MSQIRRMGRPPILTGEQQERVAALYLQGRSLKSLGREFGVTVDPIRFSLRRLGVPLRTKFVAHKGPGRWRKPNGYMEVFRNGRNIAEHRAVIEEKIGRRLTHAEHVHHINGVRDDNRIENLEIMDRKSHAALHRRWRQRA